MYDAAIEKYGLSRQSAVAPWLLHLPLSLVLLENDLPTAHSRWGDCRAPIAAWALDRLSKVGDLGVLAMFSRRTASAL